MSSIPKTLLRYRTKEKASSFKESRQQKNALLRSTSLDLKENVARHI